MLKFLCVAVSLLVAASSSPTPAIRHRWQMNGMNLVPINERVGGKIVGGVETDISQLPHQIVLHYRRSFICGGSILNTNTILSAAHCTYGGGQDDFQILAGQTNRRQGTLTQAYAVREHEQYDDWTLEFDLVILKLDTHLVESINIRPVNLPPPNHFIPAGITMTVSGWGTMEWGTQQFPDTLRSTRVPSLTNAQCQAIYNNEEILAQHVCAGQFGHDACQGDSGGPLTENVGGAGAMVVGVVSWGYYCARDYPTVYARVSYFLDWIRNNKFD